MEACPPIKRVASTKPTAPMRHGLVKASLSRAVRDREGTFFLTESLPISLDWGGRPGLRSLDLAAPSFDFEGRGF